MGAYLIKVPVSDYFICFELDISAKEWQIRILEAFH